MQTTLKSRACRTIVAVAASAVGVIGLSLTGPTALASDAMPVAQQNALVQKYCAVCHSDAQRAGGLSLERFDAAHADPGIAAMMLSKLTNGLLLERINAANTDQSAAALIDRELNTSAIRAAGVAPPDRATAHAWISALSAEANGATEWTVSRRSDNPATRAPALTASIVREVRSANNPEKADMYRLALTCRADVHDGAMQLAWAPGGPPPGRDIFVSVDGTTPLTYNVGGNGKAGPGDVVLHTTTLPEHTLTVSNVLPDQTVEFPFDNLPQSARQSLTDCFARRDVGR